MTIEEMLSSLREVATELELKIDQIDITRMSNDEGSVRRTLIRSRYRIIRAIEELDAADEAMSLMG